MNRPSIPNKWSHLGGHLDTNLIQKQKMQENTESPTVIALRTLTPEGAPSLKASTAIRIDVHDTCGGLGDYGAFGDLLKGCFIVEELKYMVTFSSYSYEPDAASEPHLQQYILRLHGTVRDPGGTLECLHALKCLATQDNEDASIELWEEIHALGWKFSEGDWSAAGHPLPALCRATWVEQLLYMIQNPDGDKDYRRKCMQEFIALEPEFADNEEFMQMYGYLLNQ